MNLLHRIRTDQKGATLVEFGLVAPTVILLMMGVFELGHTMYVQSIVNGAIQEAGRDSTVESADLEQIEADVRRQVGRIAPGAEISFKRAFHTNYLLVDRKEPFTDLDGDGKCNDGEPYEDLNENGVRDRSRGIDGQGDARDVVVFQTDVVYDRLFPMPSLSGWSETNTVVGRTMLRNQPFRQQDQSSPIGNCKGDDEGGGDDGFRGRGRGGGVGGGSGGGNGGGNNNDDDGGLQINLNL